jgi:hypothetical protein
VLHTLPVVRLSPVGSHPLEAMNGLDLHITNVRRAFVADAPTLTFQQAHNRVFGESVQLNKCTKTAIGDGFRLWPV